MSTSPSSWAPPLAALLGVRRVQGTRAGLELQLDPDRPAATPVGPLDVAVLADLALGGALRARLGVARVLPTVSLTLHLAVARPPAGVRVRAWGDGTADGLADARAEVVAGDRPIGHALATFAVPDTPSAAPPLPWEVDDRARSPQPTPDEQRFPGDERSWAEQLLHRACHREGRSLVCRPDPVLRNRAGHVQGGVLFGLAAAVAAGGVRPSSNRTVSGHMLFVAPASADAPVRAVATPVRETRRTRFVRADLHQDGEAVATAMFTFRTAAAEQRAAAGRARDAAPAHRDPLRRSR